MRAFTAPPESLNEHDAASAICMERFPTESTKEDLTKSVHKCLHTMQSPAVKELHSSEA